MALSWGGTSQKADIAMQLAAPGVGNLVPARGDASCVRVVLEGARSFALAGGGSLKLSLSASLRHDGH